MFRKDKTVENKNFVKKLEDDRFLKERFIQQNKPDLYRNAQENDSRVSTSPVSPKECISPNGFGNTPDNNVIAENRIRQQIRENSPEIRELESKLRLAYTNKLRSVQIAEKNVMLERERVRDYEDAKILAEKIAEEEKQERLKDAEFHRQKIVYRTALDEQVAEQNAQLLSNAYLDFLNEKLLVDEIVRKIIEEDRKKAEVELLKVIEYRNQIDQFLLAQEEQRRNEKKARDEENKKILAYVSYKDLEQQEKNERTQIRTFKDERIKARLLAVLEEREKKLDDQRNLRFELACEVKAKEDALNEQRLVQKQIHDRLKLRDNLERQLDYKMQIKALEKEEEKRLKEQMLEQLAVEDKLCQLSLQKRRLKQLEHRRSVEALLRQRQAERERTEQLEKEDLQKLQQIHADRQRMVEEEREKILQEHAVKLLGFLPKGVLQKNNIDLLGEDFKQFYTRDKES